MGSLKKEAKLNELILFGNRASRVIKIILVLLIMALVIQFAIVSASNNKTFEAEIKILTVHSYPIVGENWIIEFNTTGTANLTITPINDTAFLDEDNITPDHIEFLELRCGNESVNITKIYNDNTFVSVFYEDWSCDNKTGVMINKWLISAKHTIEFMFGKQTAYAFNSPDSEAPDWYDFKIWQGTYTSITTTIEDWTTECNTDPANDDHDYEGGVLYTCNKSVGTAAAPGYCSVEGWTYAGFRVRDENIGAYGYFYVTCTEGPSVCDGESEFNTDPVNGLELYNILWDGDINDCECYGKNWTGNGGSLNCCGDDTGEAGPYEVIETSCTDGNDNDCDGDIDYNDDDSCCVKAYEDLSIETDTVLCPGTYYLNDTGETGVIIINANNVELDCNGAKLVGNKSVGSVGIFSESHNDVTIKNCELKDYYNRLIHIDKQNNTRIINTTFHNATLIPLFLGCEGSNCYNTIIENSTFYSYGDSNHVMIYVDGHNDLLIKNNNFSLINKILEDDWTYAIKFRNDTSRNAEILNNNIEGIGGVDLSDKTKNITIKNNNIRTDFFPEQFTQFMINSKGSQNITITNNSCRDSHCVIEIVGSTSSVTLSDNNFYNNTVLANIILKNSRNVIIDNNVINITDTGIVVYNSTNVNITNNWIEETVTNVDAYNLGIRIEQNSSNVYINNVTIKNYGNLGILIRQASNIAVSNINCQQLSLNEAKTRGITQGGESEPTACIGILELYKWWLGDGTEQETDDISKISTYKSINVTLRNITFDSNVQTILKTQGTVNLDHDLTEEEYWYRKVQLDTNLVNATEFYNNDEWSNLSLYPSKIWDVITSSLGMGYHYIGDSGLNTRINYTIFNTSMTFKNADSEEVKHYQIRFYDLLQIAPYNDIYNITGNKLIQANADDYTVTIAPTHKIGVGDYT